MTPAGFPHSDTPGSTLGCQLPRAYRRLLRPSSALDAKASTMCPSQLVTHTTNPTHHPNTQKKSPTTAPTTGTTARPNRARTMNQTRQCTQHTTKMLASTIQISNNNPTPTRAHTRRPPQAGNRTKDPDTPNTQERLILQNPNSVPPPDPKAQQESR
jgi:hypothetical protein